MSENLTLWDSVQMTDPKYTKAFSRAGGFKGTAINATYQVKRATNVWGPLGGKWGYSIASSDYIPGADGDVIHVLQIDFRHPDGVFPSFGQTTFVGSNKNGRYTDEEAPKKSLTDAITKALSMLGFSADVHLGLFDDNKYVNDARAKFEAKPPSLVRPNSAGEDYWNNAEAEEKEFLNLCVSTIRDFLNVPDAQKASQHFYAIGSELEQAAVWSQLAKTEKKLIVRDPAQKAA